ncbi:MAG TPA: AAA family ATPase [Candidatus Dormibacteraeota bacterium]|nr:AAA family ATPase [Candidatus Dormibacteraeota bacterium]
MDTQSALDKLIDSPGVKLYGVHRQYSHETLTFANLMQNVHDPAVISPLQYEEVDIGDTLPARCLRQGLWLALSGKTPYALLMSAAQSYGRTTGGHLEIAVPPGELGSSLSRRMFEELEALVKKTASYRGKVISLEQPDRYSGQIGTLRVHKLRVVRREEVILPAKTLQLLDRNVRDFIAQREKLQELGMPIKKGLLFYGPLGTGKTHTIHYLASQLPDHTTLLVTAEQVALLDHYFQLARFLQPAMIVVEDVDLIARKREEMYGPCDESLLNKLLNEMDGLREDAAVLFVLTTNRPEQLEAALASRPGRVDQAIEFPLPDELARRQLVRLYACGLPLSDEVVESLVKKSKGASAAFIKELMRRAAQFNLQDGKDGPLTSKDVDAALEEMLFAGGSLNAKLLGASGISRETMQ